jgi:glutathione S-transferase
MRLHHHPLSSYSRKTTTGIGLRGDEVELRLVDALGGELKSAAFVALNPFGKMPLLETDDGAAIFESTSILEFLEERGPRRLLPQGQERRARHFDRLADLYLLDPVGAFFWRKTDEQEQKTTATMARAWGIWERELADGRAFVLGSEITLADLGAAVAVDYAETEGVPIPDAIQRYRDRLMANPVLAASRDAARPFIEATKPRRQRPAPSAVAR